MRNTPIKIIITSLITLFLVACATTSTVTANRKVSKPNLKEASDLNTQLAIGYIQREQYRPAKEKLAKAMDENSDIVTAYKTLAYLYDLLGLFKGALVSRFYREPDAAECPPIAEATCLADRVGAIACYAYLGDVGESPTGDKKAETFRDFLDHTFENFGVRYAVVG